MFTGVYCLCMYIASLFVISMEGMVLFYGCLELFVNIQNAPVTHRHLSVVCSVFTYIHALQLAYY